MLPALKQTVFKIFILISIGAIALSAKDIPISSSMTITIPVGEFSVLEFPFELKGEPQFSSFKYEELVNKRDEAQQEVEEQVTLPTSKPSNPGTDKQESTKNNAKKDVVKTKQNNADKSKPLDVKFGNNSVQIFSKIEGSVELIVWGYKHPIMIHVIASENANASDKYYSFIDSKKDAKKAVSFESFPHEKVITRLIYGMYNNKKPIGYKKKSSEYMSAYDDMKFVAEYELIGENYLARSGYLINEGSNKKIDQSKILMEDKNIYALTVLSDFLKTNTKTRAYIIYKGKNHE